MAAVVVRETMFVRASTDRMSRSGRQGAVALSTWLVVACGGSGDTGVARTTDGSGGAIGGSASGGASGAGGRSAAGAGGNAAGTGGASSRGGTSGAAASGTAGVDGGGADGGLCDGVVVGEPCTVENAHCGSCADECSFCHVVSCVNGAWTGFEIPPAPCFDCGPSLRCRTGGEYCDLEHSDVPSIPDAYSCRSMPPACARDMTCACVQQAVPSDRCTVQRAGELLIEHLGG